MTGAVPGAKVDRRCNGRGVTARAGVCGLSDPVVAHQRIKGNGDTTGGARVVCGPNFLGWKWVRYPPLFWSVEEAALELRAIR